MSTLREEILPTLFQISDLDDIPTDFFRFCKKNCPSLIVDEEVIRNLSEKEISMLGPYTQEFVRWFRLEKEKGLRSLSIIVKPNVLDEYDQEDFCFEYLDMITAPGRIILSDDDL